MNERDNTEITEKLQFQSLEEGKALVPSMQKMPVVEVAEILHEQESETILELLKEFTVEQQGLILSEFDSAQIYELFQLADRSWFAFAFEQMYSESRADFFQQLDRQEQVSLLPFLTKSIREDVIKLSSYPPETAGGIMSTDFATVIENMTCQQAIAKVRKDAPSKRMIYYIYVVDERMKMKGFITLKNLIMAEPDTLVQDIVHREYIYALVDEDRETVARKVEKYDLVAIPVLNHQDQLVGIVTHDEALEVIRAEQTEDMEKFMGIVPGDAELEYMDTTSWEHFKKRSVWIMSLAILGIVSGMIIHKFENALEKLIILALYMPMMADTGGNSGSQSATVVIRAMALGQITIKDWLAILWKEAKVSLMLSLVLGIIAFAKVLFLSWETDVPEAYNLVQIAVVITLALCLQVITATLIGAGLPMIVKRFGGDPAVAASPAITTVVDITGLLIYFGLAVLMLDL